MAFSYKRSVTLDHTKVPSTQSNFPVLIDVTHNDLKSTGNGGHVQSASGYDIRPYTDSALGTALTYQLAFYDPATGHVIMRAKIASLSSSVDTVPYLAYGDSGLSSDGSSTATWDSNFVSVYYFGNGTTLSLADAIGANNGTGVNTPTAATGKVDGGLGMSTSGPQYVDLGTGINPTALTYSLWINITSFGDTYNAIISRSGATYSQIYVRNMNKAAWYFLGQGGAGVAIDPGTATINTGTWYHLAMTYDSSGGLKTYVNGTNDGTGGTDGNAGTTAINTYVGHQAGQGREWNGAADELQISNIARSADWITTEYNQVAAGWSTLGSEESGAVSAIKVGSMLAMFQ